MLPKVVIPEYTITLPTTNSKIKIRPFLAQEEKILLMALEASSDPESAVKGALSQILQNCILTKDIVVSKLSRIDVETIFLNLRKFSVGEIVELSYDAREIFSCKEEKCIEEIKTTINLNDVKSKNLDRVELKMMLDDNVGVVLKPMPLFEDIEDETNTGKIFKTIEKMLSVIFTQEDVIEVSKLPQSEKDDLPSWIENSFSRQNLESVIDFLSEQPYLETKVEISCPKCGRKEEIGVRGITDFFTL